MEGGTSSPVRGEGTHMTTVRPSTILCFESFQELSGVVFIPAVFPLWKAGPISECLSGELEKIRTMTILE